MGEGGGEAAPEELTLLNEPDWTGVQVLGWCIAEVGYSLPPTR